MTSEHLSSLAAHFPDSRIILKRDADEVLLRKLVDYPQVLQFRKTNLLAPKVIDFVAYLRSNRMLVFDSDVLFFGAPASLLARIESPDYRLNSFNSDFDSAYTVDPDEAERLLNMRVARCFNSGLGLAHKDSIRLDWLEEFLTLPGITRGHFWRIEQTLYALCSSRYGVEHLPDEYTLYLDKGRGSRPFRHYVGAIRHLMYGEGIRELYRSKCIR